MSVMRAMASLDALGIRVARGVAENCGNLKFIPAASLKPSGHSLASGVPSTEQILKISSISEFPGNKGLELYFGQFTSQSLNFANVLQVYCQAQVPI